MEQMKEKTCCFTGHRRISIGKRDLREFVCDAIKDAIDKEYRHFICGGAVGFDMFCAEQIIFFKNDIIDNITLEIAVPCLDQDKYFNESCKARYKKLLQFADIIHMCSEEPYNKACMDNRNEYMVDKSSLVIAYYNDRRGDTRKTIQYAEQKGIEIWYV